ncbi:hypothetical protein RRF57_002518 [Xylaria bambusicola]|uniref:Secreted protein n=1 Tax=Xylaria bambusicola TaxID=326684 RepID=A0AAN7UDS1_9PEZI
MAFALVMGRRFVVLAGCAPLRLVFSKDLPLGVVADGPDVDKASDVELLRPEHRHIGSDRGVVVDDGFVTRNLQL